MFADMPRQPSYLDSLSKYMSHQSRRGEGTLECELLAADCLSIDLYCVNLRIMGVPILVDIRSAPASNGMISRSLLLYRHALPSLMGCRYYYVFVSSDPTKKGHSMPKQHNLLNDVWLLDRSLVGITTSGDC